MEERFAKRLISAAKRAGEDPGWKIEVTAAGIRITYIFLCGTRLYHQENLTNFRAVENAGSNPLFQAMDDLTAAVAKFKKEQGCG